jgi:hypothetical protein
VDAFFAVCSERFFIKNAVLKQQKIIKYAVCKQHIIKYNAVTKQQKWRMFLKKHIFYS